jgi:hypothetical protein
MLGPVAVTEGASLREIVTDANFWLLLAILFQGSGIHHHHLIILIILPSIFGIAAATTVFICHLHPYVHRRPALSCFVLHPPPPGDYAVVCVVPRIKVFRCHVYTF